MNNQEKKYELIKFEDGEFSLDVKVSPDEDTVWLTQRDLTLLFNVDKSRISRHIKNILDEGELDFSVVAENATTGTDGKKYSTRYYNLDMIIAIGYRVNSKRGTQFRKWANSVLKQYLLNGYSINNKRYISGGHGQTAIDYIDKNNIAYEVNIEYNNGVRVGNIIDSKNKKFKTSNNHTWFPKDWSIGDIREAGENVSGYFKSRGNIKDGQHYSLMYKGVEVTVIYQEGEVSTIYPSKNQLGGRKND